MRLLAFPLTLTLAVMPASANQPVGILQNPQGVIVLQEVQGACPSDMKRAFLVIAPAIWEGCWKAERGEVTIVWEDGDGGKGPVSAFQWAPGKKPVSL